MLVRSAVGPSFAVIAIGRFFGCDAWPRRARETEGSATAARQFANRSADSGAQGPAWLETGCDPVWLAKINNKTVYRIDPATNRDVATIGAGVPGEGGDLSLDPGLLRFGTDRRRKPRADLA
ncbi:MAG: hypothetical protein WCH32_12525 [Pseudomonadota bacterium]